MNPKSIDTLPDKKLWEKTDGFFMIPTDEKPQWHLNHDMCNNPNIPIYTPIIIHDDIKKLFQ